MFTGIISSMGIIRSSQARGDLRVMIACSFADMLKLGESVACNGACLTVIAIDGETFSADLSQETISRTAHGQWQLDKKVNLERAMKLGDALDGHMVSGHVDGIATITDIAKNGDSHILCIESPMELARFIAEKGSVTLDGISLTVNKVEGVCFWINIIPHTWQNTTLGERKKGDTLNLEIDLIARYVERLLAK
jgi:riboflavin synthase